MSNFLLEKKGKDVRSPVIREHMRPLGLFDDATSSLFSHINVPRNGSYRLDVIFRFKVHLHILGIPSHRRFSILGSLLISWAIRARGNATDIVCVA
jgi:hypothetical protein